jgi:hypothetical protein
MVDLYSFLYIYLIRTQHANINLSLMINSGSPISTDHPYIDKEAI